MGEVEDWRWLAGKRFMGVKQGLGVSTVERSLRLLNFFVGRHVI